MIAELCKTLARSCSSVYGWIIGQMIHNFHKGNARRFIITALCHLDPAVLCGLAEAGTLSDREKTIALRWAIRVNKAWLICRRQAQRGSYFIMGKAVEAEWPLREREIWMLFDTLEERGRGLSYLGRYSKAYAATLLLSKGLLLAEHAQEYGWAIVELATYEFTPGLAEKVLDTFYRNEELTVEERIAASERYWMQTRTFLAAARAMPEMWQDPLAFNLLFTWYADGIDEADELFSLAAPHLSEEQCAVVIKELVKHGAAQTLKTFLVNSRGPGLRRYLANGGLAGLFQHEDKEVRLVAILALGEEASFAQNVQQAASSTTVANEERECVAPRPTRSSGI